MKRPASLLDCEVFRDYFLAAFTDVDTGRVTEFELWPGRALDVLGLRWKLAAVTIVTFNGNHYDEHILKAALQGWSCEQLKWLSDCIINGHPTYGKLAPWKVPEVFGLYELPELDHVDLFEIPPGQASLKIYGGKMHSKRIQDLPYEHTASIAPEHRAVVRNYCTNDRITTGDLLRQFSTQLKQREDLSEQYGLDLRSKSDAQIAEAVIRKQLAFKPQRPEVHDGMSFTYEVPSFIYFQTQPLRDLLGMLRTLPFRIGANGVLLLHDELKALRIPIGSNAYTVKMGGLHSTETRVCHIGGNLEDIDVASYYPKTIDLLGLYPQQIGPAFLTIFRKLITMRLEAKARGDKKLADMLKIVINGTYGKLGQPGGVLWAPHLMLQVTLTGQLALLMLIEAMELNGIQCASANTDGIVLKCADELVAQRLAVRQWWESVTGYALEGTPYAAIFIRDVNSYIAFKPDGTAKTKGEFSDPVPVASSWPNPECQISVDAMIAYLRDGTPIEHTVRACKDVRQFVAVRKVTSGGVFNGEKLGRAVRWYYSRQGGTLTANNGNRVSNGEGVRPMMELPDTLPLDLDFDYYITRAKRMLLTVGVTFVA